MTHPKVRLTITFSESSLLRPGLDALNTGLATAAHGDFPDFYAECLGPWGRDIHPNRRFDIEMAGRIPGLHQQLATNTFSRKVRLDLFDIATAQFALRLLKRSSSTPHNPVTVRSLDLKLEKYRKRAKRKAENIHGNAAVSESSETWRAFVSWCRFNLLHFRIPARTFAWPRKGLWAQQRFAIADMIKLALEERCYAALEEAQIKRMVRLIKEEFHRGRHAMTLRELLAGEQTAGRALLFKLVAKKLELTTLPGAELPNSIAASERGERFTAARAPRMGNPVRSSEPLAQGLSTRIDSPDEPKASAQAKSHPAEPASVSQISVSQTGLTTAITNWLRENVDPKLWPPVTEQVRFAIQNGLPWAKSVPAYDGIADLIRKSRPFETTYDPTEIIVDIALPADWLFTWVTKLQPNPAKAYSAVLYGYGNALKIQKDTLYN